MRFACVTLLAIAFLMPAERLFAKATEPNRVVELQGLDKVTARVAKFQARVGEETRFGSLGITPRACLTAPPIDPPEAAAFLEIRDVEPKGGAVTVFDGWMMASTPGLSALEHPVYDVWVVGCAEPSPAAAPSMTLPANP